MEKLSRRKVMMGPAAAGAGAAMVGAAKAQGAEVPNLSAGDNPRRSLAGFFLEKNPITARAQSGERGGMQ
jgi:hypothetical protein